MGHPTPARNRKSTGWEYRQDLRRYSKHPAPAQAHNETLRTYLKGYAFNADP